MFKKPPTPVGFKTLIILVVPTKSSLALRLPLERQLLHNLLSLKSP